MNQGTQDVGVAISAAGTTQATATVLINGIALVTTVASGAGVSLTSNPSGVGCSQFVFNGGANALKVYPPSGYKINNLTTDLPMTLSTNTACQFWFVSSTQIIGFLSA